MSRCSSRSCGRWIIGRGLLLALVLLVVFLFGGQYLPEAIGLSESSVTVAGGLILFLIALNMVFPSAGGVFGEDVEDVSGAPFSFPSPCRSSRGRRPKQAVSHRNGTPCMAEFCW